MIIEIGPNLLKAFGLAAFAYFFNSFFHYLASISPYYEIHEERVKEVSHQNVR